jgi:predicted DNA-binding transcriptional regulator YafY
MTASGKEEIKAWILSFGPKAELVSPKRIRENIVADLSRAYTHYTESKRTLSIKKLTGRAKPV